jgi:hypothetical protein
MYITWRAQIMPRLIKSHKCENTICNNITSKNKYGNYMLYCCKDCKSISTKAKFAITYANKDMNTILEKRQATNIEKYGVDNVSKTTTVRAQLKKTTTLTATIRTAKTKVTNLLNHGVESTNSLQSVKDKKKESFLEKYGVDHQLKIPEIAASVSKKNTDNAVDRLAKATITNIDRYGTENPLSNKDVQNKRTDTMIERFGVENASQNPEIHAKKVKNGYKSKQYIMPSGAIIFLQGWENKALDDMLKEYTEKEISTKTAEIPRITYYDDNGKKHYYFPDFYIAKDNLIIEVKSEWTYNKNVPRHNMKRDACLAQGYKFKFMIYKKTNEYTELLSH